MPLFLNIISLTSDIYDSNFVNRQAKQTSEFFYFHSKKWVLKLVHKFLMKFTDPIKKSNR